MIAEKLTAEDLQYAKKLRDAYDACSPAVKKKIGLGKNHRASISGQFDTKKAIPFIQTLEPGVINQGKGNSKKLQIYFLDQRVLYIYGVIGNKKYFIPDGWSPQWNAHIEIKYCEQQAGTAQEKIDFDLNKIRNGVYAQRGEGLIYILAGGMETHYSGRIFTEMVREEQEKLNPFFAPDRFRVIRYSEIIGPDGESLWRNVFTPTGTIQLATSNIQNYTSELSLF